MKYAHSPSAHLTARLTARLTALGIMLSSSMFVAACSSSQSAAPEASAEASTAPADDFEVLTESFADLNILRYRVPGFDELAPKQKEMLYYLYEAALSGRDIIYDQNNLHNLAVRRTLDAVVQENLGSEDPDFAALHEYAKRVWFSHGFHHHYASKKFVPGFSKEAFARLVHAADPTLLPLTNRGGEPITVEQLIENLTPVLYDDSQFAIRVNRADGADLAADSANNFYEGVTQKEVEAFYKAKGDPNDPRPLSYGLNSKLVKEDGKVVEKVWKVGGMYSGAIEKIAYWLKKASGVAENERQKAALDALVTYYETGDLKNFADYNIKWVQDTDSRIDVVNGFIETYGDAMAYRGSFESVVSIRDLVRTKRIATIGDAAQWFEDHSPISDEHKKKEVKGISAKVITIVIEGGDAAPQTPIGINLPNSNWIRKEHGSKSVFLGNIVDAYQEVLLGSGVLDEFTSSDEERERAKKHNGIGYALKVDMHEVIGHASGQIEEGVGTPKETLKAYAAPLEEARADLVALYYVMDPKLIELGVMESLEVGKASYDGYIRNALLTQLARIEAGEKLAQTHMRSRHTIGNWAFQKGAADNVIEKIERDGKFYFRINDYDKLRGLWGELLAEVQRIKSTGDYEAGKALIETYGVNIDAAVHNNVLERYAKLPIKPYNGFIQPKLTPIEENGSIVDVKIEYPDDFTQQMLEYGRNYSLLPTYN